MSYSYNPYKIWIVIAATAWLASSMGCGPADSTPAKATSGAPEARVINVKTYALKADTLKQYSRLAATAQAWEEVNISFQEAGVVQAVYKKLGDSVAVGDKLAGLNTELLEAAALEARAAVKYEQYNFDRTERLHQQGSLSEHELFTAEYNLKRARTALETIQIRLKNAVLIAPFAGQIAQCAVKTGQHIQPGTVALRLVQTWQMKANVWVPENEIVDFNPGRPVLLHFEAFPNITFHGIVGRIGPEAESTRRVFPMEVHLPNPSGQLRVGMMGRVEMTRRTFSDAIIIPRDAVMEREKGPAVFVIQEGKAQLRSIRLGAGEGDRVVVEEGLEIGAQLVVSGGRTLIDGDRVNVTEVVR